MKIKNFQFLIWGIKFRKMKTFEEALRELEKIIEDLERGELTLNENVEKFKQGVELINFCKKELNEAETIIKKIMEDNGEINIEKFEDNEDV